MPDALREPRLWTGDITPEKLQNLLVEHGERMAVISDEGGIFEIMAGLYNDGKANNDIFLQGHAGSAVRVDRQGRTAHLDAPALTFGLAVQPAVVQGFEGGSKKRFRGNGTLARFLYTVPVSNIGNRDVRAHNPVNPGIEGRYKAGLFTLLSVLPQMSGGKEIPRKLRLSPEALYAWQELADMVEKRQGRNGDLEELQDWAGKLPGAALRIAGVFHLVKHGPNGSLQIDLETILPALDLCQILINHAKHAFGLMQVDMATEDAKAIYRWIADQNFTRVKRTEVMQKFKGRFSGKRERMDKALADLSARLFIFETKEKTEGRTASVYTVNPLLWDRG